MTPHRRFAQTATALVGIMVLATLSPSLGQSKGGRWTFEGYGMDTATWDNAENNGYLSGGAVFSNVPSPPESGFCLWLDSSVVHDCFLVPDGDDLDFEDEPFGFSAWIYPIVLNDVHFVINKGDQAKNPKTTNYAVRISTSRNLEFLIRDRNNQARTVASRFLIPLDQWTFIAVFYDHPSGKVYMWNQLVQTPVDTLLFAQSYFPNTDPLTIGSWYTSVPSSSTIKDFEGGLDDVRISGRIQDILSASSDVDDDGFSRGIGKPLLRIFPNPASAGRAGEGVLILVERSKPESGTIRIMNILGQSVFAYRVDPSLKLETIRWEGQNVPEGLYVVVFDSPSGRVVEKLRMIR